MRGGNGSVRPLVSSLSRWMRAHSLRGGVALGSPVCSSLGRHSAPSDWVLAGPVLSVLCDYWCAPHAAAATLLWAGGKRGCLSSGVRDGKWRADTAPCHIQFLISLSHFLQNTNLTFLLILRGSLTVWGLLPSPHQQSDADSRKTETLPFVFMFMSLMPRTLSRTVLSVV